MIFYSLKQDYFYRNLLSENHYKARPASQPATPEAIARYVYCNTVADSIPLGRELESRGMAALMERLPEAAVRRWPGFPVELGVPNTEEFERNQYVSGLIPGDGRLTETPRVSLKKQLQKLAGRELRVAVVNGVGGGIGDTIMGLPALREARRVLAAEGRRVRLEMLVSEETFDRVREVYEVVDFIDGVRTLPISLRDLCGYDAFFDTGGLAHRGDFGTLPMVDFFFKLFGIDHRKVPPGRKRIRLRLPRRVDPALKSRLLELKAGGKRLLLFHPLASTPLRSVPQSETPRLLQALIEDGRYQVIVMAPVGLEDERVIDLTACSGTRAGLIYLVSQMDAILTVDTSVYHLADCFDVPSIVWFTSIDPELRLKYYPYARGILLPGARELPTFSKNTPKAGDDLEPVFRLWERLDMRESLDQLDELVALREQGRGR